MMTSDSFEALCTITDEICIKANIKERSKEKEIFEFVLKAFKIGENESLITKNNYYETRKASIKNQP